MLENNHYSPLPQALSDDEDENEELKSTFSCSNGVDADRHGLNHLMNENSTPLISLQLDDRKSMSWSRKLCFLSSVFIACAVVASFLWLLPCDLGYAPCQLSKQNTASPDWQFVIPSAAFSSGLELVDADQDGLLDIILGFHQMMSNSSLSEAFDSPSIPAGVVVLRGYDGKKLWDQSFYSPLTDIVCNILDANKDGVKDCILIGNQGLFTAINVSNEYTFWYLHDHGKARKLIDVSLPALIPDVTGDGIDDLIISCHLSDDPKPFRSHVLVVVSGGMGEIWGDPLSLTDCPVVSKPVAAWADGSTYLFVNCERDDEAGAVLVITLDQLKEEVLGNVSLNISTEPPSQNSADVMTAIHRFEGQGSHLHLLVEDLNNDNVEDILMIGGDGEIAAYNITTSTFLWSHQIKGFDILSCILGPSFDYKYKTVLLTLVLQNCSEDCSTILMGLSGMNGSEIWNYSNKSVTSPVIIPKSETWQNFVAFKAFAKLPSEHINNAENTSANSVFNNHTSNEDTSSTESEENSAMVLVNEKLLLLNAQYDLQERKLYKTTTCYELTKHLPACLPTFDLQASDAIADFDGDERADLISITTFKDNSKYWKLLITKTNLATEMANRNNPIADVQVGHLQTFE